MLPTILLAGPSSRPRQTRRRGGCEVGRDDLQVFIFAHRSGPMRDYPASTIFGSIRLCRFHATPCARLSHARAHVVPPPPPPPPPTLAIREKHASITDRSIHRGKFLPRHVRARPMRALTCTPPLWCRRRLARQHSSPMLPQLRQGRRRRDGDKSRSSC